LNRAPLLPPEKHDTLIGELNDLSLLRPKGKRLDGAELLLRAIAERITPLLPEGVDALADGHLIYTRIYAGALERLGRGSAAAKNSADQSWRSASGNFYQRYIQKRINEETSSHGLLALTETELHALPQLIEFLKLPAKRRCLQSSISVWPDNDIILVTLTTSSEWRAVGIISCKTSLRERVFESAFWTLATRDTGLRSGFVTADLDDELAECGGSGKNRQIVETYFDRAYSTNPATRFCPQVRPFSEACSDLLRWQRDVVADPLTDPLDYKSGSWAPALTLASSQ
jgi:hypothetical protein